MRDDDAGPPACRAVALRRRLDLLTRVPFFDVLHKSLRRATDVVKVHRVCADARKLRPLCGHRAVGGLAALWFGHDLPHRPSAQTTRAELESLIKAIVQLIPFTAGNEFFDHASIQI